jgi:Domain of unknown function (DUF6883)
MKLPHADHAIIDIAKLRDYSLNPLHPEGKHKARVFASLLGFTAADAETLRNIILNAILIEEAIEGVTDEHGQRFVVDFATEGLRGIVTIRTVWIIDRGETVPRLVSCYVKRK